MDFGYHSGLVVSESGSINSGALQARVSSRIQRTLTGLLFGTLLLSGCGGHVAPVSDRSLNSAVKASASRSYQQPPSSGSYRVKPGDTLYSIAWRYRKDYRTLARANGIGSDYRIYTGQLISLNRTVEPKRAPATKASAKQRAPVRSSSSTATKTKTNSYVASGPIKWRWPAKGRVIQGFSSTGKLNKGLNISGNRGDPVYSAAVGVVVYAGNGLLGYGNLIIVNHNDSFLSAYAHNHRLLVKEQDTVKSGQKIAEIGNSGAAQTMLHFEIRKEGKPVDPSRYLPRR